MSNTSTATRDGKGITRPPIASIDQASAGQPRRIIFVTKHGLAVVGYADKMGAEVRHV